MTDHDQHSNTELATVETEESTTTSPPSVSEPAQAEAQHMSVGWTAQDPVAQPADHPSTAAAKTERPASAAKPERKRKPRQPRPHMFVTVSHWAMTLLIALSFLTGIRLTWGFLESPFRSWSIPLESIAPEGTLLGINIITLHVVISFLMIGIAVTYVAYLFRSGASRRLRVNAQTFQKLREGAKGLKWAKSALWSSNLLVYWIGFAFIVILMLTGVAIYRVDWGFSALFGGYEVSRLLHSLVSYLFLPYVLLHMTLQWCFGRFWTIFKAQAYAPHIRAGLTGLAAALPLAVGFYVINEVPSAMTAKRIPANLQAPTLDGTANDPVWQHAETITVRTVKGVNNPLDYVDVDMQALHDGQHVYFKFEWDDPEASYKRFPLLKTANGWKVLETAKKWGDENIYYEDKFSMYITDVTGGSCADTCHLGVGPHADRDQKHGLHYTNGHVGDVWHWKSVRTNYMHLDPAEPGYMDDQHFRALELPMPENPKKRYKGGYHPDPKTGGGYGYNYVKLDKDKPLSQARVHPRYLPRTLNIRPNPDPTTSEEDYIWWLHKETSVPYSEALDTYPVGTVLPNIWTSPFEGGRAHVRAKAQWVQGRWTLEVRRVLDTQSEYDVAFSTERPVYLTLAPYNRAQTRHSEHIEPVQLTLEK